MATNLSNFQEHIADPSNRLALQQEYLNNMIESMNSSRKIVRGTVVYAENQTPGADGNLVTAIRIRAKGLHNSFIPDIPDLIKDDKVTNRVINTCMECHPVVYPKISQVGDKTEEGQYFGASQGDVVELELNENGQLLYGKTIGFDMSYAGIVYDFTPSNKDKPATWSESAAAAMATNRKSQVGSLGTPVPPPGKVGLNVKPADRQKGDIKYIVLHVTQGATGSSAAQSIINWFAKGPTGSYKWKNSSTGETIKNPPCEEVLKVDGMIPDNGVCRDGVLNEKKSTSIHYAVDQGGNAIQGAQEKDICSHAGSGYNGNSIGIEMCGKSQDGPGKGSGGKYSQMYNDQLLNACAKLCAQICKRWDLKPNRDTIIGHEEIYPAGKIGPGATIGKTDFGKKYGQDTGNYWNWADFIAILNKHYTENK